MLYIGGLQFTRMFCIFANLVIIAKSWVIWLALAWPIWSQYYWKTHSWNGVLIALVLLNSLSDILATNTFWWLWIMLLSMWKLSHFKLIWQKLLWSFYMNIFKPNFRAHLPLLWPQGVHFINDTIICLVDNFLFWHTTSTTY